MKGRTFSASAYVGSALAMLLSMAPISARASAQAAVVRGLSISAPAVLHLAGGPRQPSNHPARDAVLQSHEARPSKRYYHGIVNRFSAGDSSRLGGIGINDVTMKRGVIGTGAVDVPARASSPLIRRPR
jgi:hypothetical protein